MGSMTALSFLNLDGTTMQVRVPEGAVNFRVRELREVIKKYPGTEEDRRARAKLKEMGASLSASQ